MKLKSLLLLSVGVLSMMPLTGCRYAANRTADLGDIFQIGGGLTTENKETGMLPPSLGLHLQLTEFLNLGAVHFTGLGAELDGRGAFAGYETRTRLGFGPWQRVKIGQDYDAGSENYFKKGDTLWADRMHTDVRSPLFGGVPAKDLHNDALLIPTQEGTPIFDRGWQYWENANIELSIAEPFVTHFGFNVRLGVDISEVSDFVLGWFTVDFKHDDLTIAEYEEMLDDRPMRDFKPAANYPEGGSPVPPIEPLTVVE